jgi:predicted AAA+ superfamily ATPase
MARQWTREHKTTPALYINFEDERLDLTTEELSLIIECYREMYPDSDNAPLGLFFDEIQIVPNWERFLRRCSQRARRRRQGLERSVRFPSLVCASDVR